MTNDLLKLYSILLDSDKNYINESKIKKITNEYISLEYAYALLISGLFNLDIEDKHKVFFNEYILPSIKLLDSKKYLENPYYKNIIFKNKKFKDWEFKMNKYKPYQAFVYNDFIDIDGKILPQIGFFDKPFYYPAVYQKNHLWMSITPNEIETMQEDIDNCFGRVITFGLGLGYFTYMTSNNDNVNEVFVIEKDKNIISLFCKEILPQFPNKDKIKIINADCFTYLENLDDFQYAYFDIWHDVSDAIDLYKRIKPYEEKYPNTIFRYWIYNTFKY